MQYQITYGRLLMLDIFLALRQLDAQSDPSPGPRLAMVQLGRMMSRWDMETALALARELDPTGHDLGLVESIRQSWGASGAPRRRTGAEGLAERLGTLRARVKRSLSPSEYLLLELGSLMPDQRGPRLRQGIAPPAWTRVAQRFPGRDWQSLRQDYGRVLVRVLDEQRDLIRALLPQLHAVRRVAQRRSGT